MILSKSETQLIKKCSMGWFHLPGHTKEIAFSLSFFMVFLVLTDTVCSHMSLPSLRLYELNLFIFIIIVKYQGFIQVLPLEHFYGINMQLRIKFILNNHAVFTHFSMKAKIFFLIVYLWLEAATKLVCRRAVTRPHRR